MTTPAPLRFAPWVNVVRHTLMPVVVVVDGCVQPPRRRVVAVLLWQGQAQAVPAAYLAYTLLRGAQVGWSPYPFLDPARVGAGTAVWPVTPLASGPPSSPLPTCVRYVENVCQRPGRAPSRG